MVPGSHDTWHSLSAPWRGCFTEAWSSWCHGSLGIGAVLFDPATSRIVAGGCNRVNETTDEPRTLSGNFMAHAEMNAFAAMTSFKADGLHLYTTLQPCLMCSASAVFLHVEQIFYAAADEYFDGIHDLWDHHPYSRRWKPIEIGPINGPLASFARLLPLTVQVAEAPDSPVMTLANERTPEVAALAVEVAADRTLERIRDEEGSISDALTEVWSRLPG